MIILNVIVCFTAILFGFKFKKHFAIFNSFDKKLLNKLFVFHLLIGLFFYYQITNFGGDPLIFWFLTDVVGLYEFQDIINLISVGNATGYMLLLNYVPAKLLGLSFFTGNIIYSVLGFIGFIYFYAIIKEEIPAINNLNKQKTAIISFFPYLLFLPNLHFWVSGISKDTLLFLSIAVFIYSLKHLKKRIWGILFAIALSFVIRPHITLFLLIAFGMGFLLDGRLKVYQKVFIFLIFVVGFISMFDYVLRFVQLESFDTATIEKYSDTTSTLLADESGSGIDTSSYSFPLKVFTFLYRPLFFDGINPLYLVASLENLLLLLFSLKILFNKPIKSFRNGSSRIKGLFFFLIIGSISFSLILGNLGIMLRQKTPFIMVLLLFGFYVISIQIERKIQYRNSKLR